MDSPQSWNRFSYVVNNPIRFNDPTGHVCSDPENPNPSCEGSANQTTRVGNKMIRGNGKTIGGCGGRGQLKCGNLNPKFYGPLPNRPTSTPTLNPTLSSFLTASPTGTLPTLGPAYVQGPTSTSTPTATLTPTATATPAPQSTLNPDHIAIGINEGSDGVDAYMVVKTGEQYKGAGSTWLTVFLSGAAQLVADSNDNFTPRQESLRVGLAVVEGLIKAGIVGSITAGVFVGLGGPADPLAYIAAGAAMYASAKLVDNVFSYVNDKVVYPGINSIK